MEEKATTILIVDDKIANISVLENLLEKPGRSFISATSGKDGLKLALNHPVDLIFLDVQMPELDGFEVAHILKSNKRTRDIPIIFASAEKKERQSIMKGFDEGAVDYLSKPLDPELTKAKVSVLLKLQAQKKELIEKNQSLEEAKARIKTLNTDLEKQLMRVEAMNKELEAFSYSVSHDLRAPLRSIIGYSEILGHDYAGALDTEGKRILNVIQQNSMRMNALIDDLLEFARLGRTPVRKSTIDMAALVSEVLSNITTPAAKKADIEIGDLPKAYADRSLLMQVWINLLSNAIKYSSKKESPRIQVGAEVKDEEHIYIVRDNGTGFDMTYADKLFNVFQRLHKASEFEGTGVGLALVHKIIDRHGGKVWGEGKVGEGATFYFSLPVNDWSSEKNNGAEL